MAPSYTRKRSPTLAAILSFIFPGLGQAYLGRRQTALLYALPVLGLLALIGFRVVSEGIDALALEMFSPSLSLTVLGIIVVLGLWWIVALVEAFSAAGGRRPLRVLPAAFVAVLALSVASVTGYGAYNAWNLYDAGQRIFGTSGPDGGMDPSPGPQGTPDGSPGASANPNSTDPPFADATPLTVPAPGSTRITALLTGTDYTPGRDHALNDSMIVVSLDTATGKLSMVSMARDIAGFPMWDGTTFSGKINSLMSAASGDKTRFPLGGINTLVKELSYLLGIPINYYAAVNLPGFKALVDAVGGVTVYNDTPIADPVYDWLDGRPQGFSLGVGTFTLDGQRALAFARSRFGPGNNDFVRARRQQQLLLVIEKRMASPSMIPRLPGIIQALGNTVRTNYPADGLGAALAAAKRVDGANTTRVVLGPPFSERSNDPSTYSLTLDMTKLAALSIQLYGADSAYYVPSAPTPDPSATTSP